MRPPFSSDVVVCFFYSIQILFFHTLWLDDLYLSAVIEHPRKERWANSDFCGHHKGFIVEQVCFHVFTETVYNLCLTLFDKEHSYCTGKNEHCAAKTEICSLAACVPLHIGLTKQIYTHQRNAQIDCLCPYIKYL